MKYLDTFRTFLKIFLTGILFLNFSKNECQFKVKLACFEKQIFFSLFYFICNIYIYFNLTYFNLSLIFSILFLASGVELLLFFFSRSFILVEMGKEIPGALCWVCEIVRLFFSFLLFFL